MIDFEALVPDQCRDCSVLRGMISKKEWLLSCAGNLLESDVQEGEALDLGNVFTKIVALEEEARDEVLVFINRCEETTTHLQHGDSEGEVTIYCRMPPSDWKGAF